MNFKIARFYWLLGIAITLAAVFGWVNRKEITFQIGCFNRDKLETMDFGACLDGKTDMRGVRPCLDRFATTYFILGDTTSGDFRIVFTKPYAESYLEFSRWKSHGMGRGITEKFSSEPCFLHQGTEIPELSEKEKTLLQPHLLGWVEKNPEAYKRFIVKVVDADSEVVILSAPLEKLQNYTEYCPEGTTGQYLDVYNYDLDEVAVIKKNRAAARVTPAR